MSSLYKYKTSFASQIQSGNSDNLKQSLASASLDELKQIAPRNIDFDQNIDLLGVAFNAAVVNMFNKNHDGISTDTALAVSPFFKHKPTNIEHNKEKIVGHVVDYGFSSFNDNKILAEEDINEDDLELFNIALSAVIYKTIDESFASLVERSTNPNDSLFNSISASWEIGFNDYIIAIGSKNLKEAELVVEEKQIKELSDYLKAFGGEGRMKDGTEIYRLVAGDVYPLGIGFTTNPAANVEGLIKLDNKKKDHEDQREAQAETEKIEIDLEKFLKKIIKSKKKLSHNEKEDVILNKADFNSHTQKMETKEFINEIKETIKASASDKFSEEAVANVLKVVTDAIKERSDSYVLEKAEIEKQKEEAEAAKAESEAKTAELESALAETSEKLSALEAEIKEAKDLQLFNDRMQSLDDSYELNDADRKIIASEIESLDDTEESFASYMEKVEVIFSHKNKEFIKEQEEKFNQRVEEELLKRAQASESKTEDAEEKVENSSSDEIEEALESIEASEDISSNNGESIEKEISLKDKFKNAFSKESITIKY